MNGDGADRELLERLYRETGAERAPAEWSWIEAVVDVLRRGFDAFNRWFLEGLTSLGPAGEGLVWLVWGLAGLLTLLAIGLLVRGWRRRGLTRRKAELGDLSVVEADAWRVRDAPGWWNEMEARLAAGDVEGALAAGWWWLATSLGAAAEPSWTTRELVRRAGRPELLPLVRPFDVFAYGPRRPEAEEVRGLLERMAEALR